MNENIKITIETADGTLVRNYTVSDNTDYNDIIPDMLDSLKQSAEVTDEVNQDAGLENMVNVK